MNHAQTKTILERCLFAQALEDALGHTGLELFMIPLNPSQLWEKVQAMEIEAETILWLAKTAVSTPHNSSS